MEALLETRLWVAEVVADAYRLSVSSRQLRKEPSPRQAEPDSSGAGAGTVFLKTISWPAGILKIGNGGSTGAPTYIRSTMWTAGTTPELVVDDYAWVHPVGPMSFLAASVSGHGVLSHDAETKDLNLIIQGNFSIGSDGAIDADGKGYPASTGPGTMSVGLTNGSGGAGYGGEGGHGTNATAWKGGPCLWQHNRSRRHGQRGLEHRNRGRRDPAEDSSG